MPIFVGGLIKGDFDSLMNVEFVKTEWKAHDFGDYTQEEVARYQFYANVQPMSDKEIDILQAGGERIVDARKIYINDRVDLIDLHNGYFEFDGSKWKILKIDKRSARSYLKASVNRMEQDQ